MSFCFLGIRICDLGKWIRYHSEQIYFDRRSGLEHLAGGSFGFETFAAVGETDGCRLVSVGDEWGGTMQGRQFVYPSGIKVDNLSTLVIRPVLPQVDISGFVDSA